MATTKAKAEELVPKFKFERQLNQGKPKNQLNVWKPYC